MAVARRRKARRQPRARSGAEGSGAREAVMSSGVLVAVVGPSGVGKATLIGHARARLAGEDGFVFIRRLVTRGENAFEDHDTLDEAAFARGVAEEHFALHWRA